MKESKDSVPGPDSFVASEREEGSRLDRVLADRIPNLSRSRLQALIKSGCVILNGEPATRPRQAVSTDDRIAVRIPEPESAEILPEEIPLEVLFEDDHLVVIDKPAGLVVHPAAGNPNGTLVNALLHHCRGQLSRIGEEDRPGIVHRLDKDTSGCLVAAKSDEAAGNLIEQFAGREIEKVYLCVVQGCPGSSHGRIENRIGRHPVRRQQFTQVEDPAGKLAITDYEVLNSDPKGEWAALRCRIHTGRTHQIRVHMKESLRCPILGDEIYAQPRRQSVRPDRMMLHAWKLAFRHPVTGRELEFESTLPDAFREFLPD